MEISDALVNIAIGLMGGITGGVVTGIYTLKATDKAIRKQDEQIAKNDEKEVQNLLDALGVEISALWNFHMKRIGHVVEVLPAGRPLEFYYPLTQDYFTIYNSTAAVIGRIKDAALREAIVVCYNKCKKAVDGFKYNNDLFKQYRDLIHMPVGADKEARVAEKLKELVDFAVWIKEDHFELKGYVENLLRRLAERYPEKQRLPV